jgi:acetyl-CoA carboxylase carboxyltransferase component
MIDPRDTRAVIAMSLSACYNNNVEGTKEFGTWRM